MIDSSLRGLMVLLVLLVVVVVVVLVLPSVLLVVLLLMLLLLTMMMRSLARSLACAVTAVAGWLQELSVELIRECAALVYYALARRL